MAPSSLIPSSSSTVDIVELSPILWILLFDRSTLLVLTGYLPELGLGGSLWEYIDDDLPLFVLILPDDCFVLVDFPVRRVPTLTFDDGGPGDA